MHITFENVSHEWLGHKLANFNSSKLAVKLNEQIIVLKPMWGKKPHWCDGHKQFYLMLWKTQDTV